MMTTTAVVVVRGRVEDLGSIYIYIYILPLLLACGCVGGRWDEGGGGNDDDDDGKGRRFSRLKVKS